jgi:hypothetical protein
VRVLVIGAHQHWVDRFTLCKTPLAGLEDDVSFGKPSATTEPSPSSAPVVAEARLDGTGLRCRYGRTAISQLLKKYSPQIFLNAFLAVVGKEHRTIALAATQSEVSFEDALRELPPAVGIGTNAGLRDAELLSQKLAKVSRREKPLSSALHEYETAILHYGFEGICHSLHQLGPASGRLFQCLSM